MTQLRIVQIVLMNFLCYVTLMYENLKSILLYPSIMYVIQFYYLKIFKIIYLCAVDFTLEELKSLRVKQRYSFRDQQYNG